MTSPKVLKMNLGFTLIELLIVVAIIAILAGIAIPNFLAAQTRSKVARVQKEMQSLATALELYYVDNTSYPLGFFPNISGYGGPGWHTYDLNPYYLPRLIALSTPITYLSSMPRDIFNPGDEWTTNPATGNSYELNTYIYYPSKNLVAVVGASWTLTYPTAKWRLASYGPRLTRKKQGGLLSYYVEKEIGLLEYEYDPTNGTTSFGFISRFGP
jgi:prepilin-type N-terminal cleavage/methylation domain-containing protein